MLYTECPYCCGRGLIKTHETLSIEIERDLKKVVAFHQQFGLKLVCHPELDRYLENFDKGHLLKLAKKINAKIEFGTDDRLHINDYQFVSVVNGKKIEI